MKYAVVLYDGVDNITGFACKDDDSGDIIYFDTKEQAEQHGKEVSAWHYKVV